LVLFFTNPYLFYKLLQGTTTSNTLLVLFPSKQHQIIKQHYALASLSNNISQSLSSRNSSTTIHKNTINNNAQFIHHYAQFRHNTIPSQIDNQQFRHKLNFHNNSLPEIHQQPFTKTQLTRMPSLYTIMPSFGTIQFHLKLTIKLNFHNNSLSENSSTIIHRITINKNAQFN
jgi:hypothetical protein